MKYSIQPINRTKVSLAVAAKLHEILLSGEYGAGDKLPTEKELTERFGVSRSSIREALRRLEAEGLVQVVHGVGTIVSGNHETTNRNNLTSILVIQGTTVSEFLESRMVIESETASRAADRLTTSDANELRQILTKLNDKELSDEEYVEADAALHLAIARASKNTILVRMLETLKDVMIEYSLKTIKFPGRRERANEGHRVLVEAILAGSPSKARKAAKDHIETVECEIFELLEGGESHVIVSHDHINFN